MARRGRGGQWTQQETLTADPARRVAVSCNVRHWQKEVTAVATSLPDPQVSRSRSRSRLAEGVPRPRSRRVAGQKLSEFARMTRFPCGGGSRKNVGCTLRRRSACGPAQGSCDRFPASIQEHNIISLSRRACDAEEPWAEYKRLCYASALRGPGGGVGEGRGVVIKRCKE